MDKKKFDTVHILYFNDEDEMGKIQGIVNQVREVLGPDCLVLALPRNYSLILDCSYDQLLQTRDIIDYAIEAKGAPNPQCYDPSASPC